MRNSSFWNQIGERASREKSRSWRKLTMNAWPSYMKDSNRTNRYSWWWNTSMEDLFMDISKESQTDKWLKSKLSSSGNRLFSEFITCIKETWLIEISSLRIFFWTRPGPESNWLILDFLLAFLMKRKLKSSAEHHHIWHQRSWAKLSMQDLQQMYGLLASCCSLYCVAVFHSKVKTIKNYIQTYADKICQLPITSPDKQNNCYWKFSRRIQIKDRAVKIFLETHGSNSQLEIKKWCHQSRSHSSNS